MLLQREVVAGGHQLEIAVVEPPAAIEPAIVLLHEGLGSVAAWKTFPERLAERTRRRVVVYSRYGYGNSDVLAAKRDPDYMHREGEVVLPELIAQLELRNPILFGHSDGASIALVCAGAHPELISALVLEAPHVFVEALSVASIAAAAEAYRTTDLPRRLARYHADANRTFWGWNDIWLDPRFRAWNIESHLASVRCPVLVIQGDDDEYGTAAQLDAISARIPDARIVRLAHCAHAPHRDRERETLDAAAHFLDPATFIVA